MTPQLEGQLAAVEAVPAEVVPAEQVEGARAPGGVDPRLFVNRELSLLAFQRRVFEEARDPQNPLLERVKFLGIVASNLDELYMIRIAGLRQQVAAGVSDISPDGRSPAEVLVDVRKDTHALSRALLDCLHRELIPELAAAGVHLLNHGQLTSRQQAQAAAWFEEIAFPVLTPLAFDPGRPFPHISNLSLNLGVLVEGPGGVERFARVKVPQTLPRLVPLARPSVGRRDRSPHAQHFVWLESLIAAHVDRLFPGLRILDVQPFHVTRDAELTLQEMEAADLLETIEHGVRRRRFGSVVRLVVTPGSRPSMRELLVDNLETTPADVEVLEGPLALAEVTGLSSVVDRPELKFPSFVPRTPRRLRVKEGDDLFAVIRRNDVLLHHPFDSFAPVVEFLQTAARDPNVLAIKQTLYRVGRNSPVVEALLEASENGKQVAVLVELKARFDEESNIGWARALEAEGVHVIYGLLGFKTHSKIAMVVRREGEHLSRYVHLSTGNYNPVTAGVYTDLGLFTCDPEIGEDVTHLFNYLTGYSLRRDYKKLLVAPINLRERLLELIAREIAHAQAGRGGHLVLKINALVDREMVVALARASQAGVKVDLVVRGICCLRPGLPGLSEHVTVTSVVGRFLEHSRVFWFRNGGQEEVYLGSADLMTRNLDRRVEVLFPVRDPELVRHLRDEVLATYLADDQRARRMLPDGTYQRLQPVEGGPRIDSQLRLLGASPGREPLKVG